MSDYKVITHPIPVEFEKLVKQALIEGWELVGGVSTIIAEGGNKGVYQTFYFQAVAK